MRQIPALRFVLDTEREHMERFDKLIEETRGGAGGGEEE
jgi:hypothetical protein